MKKIFFIVFVLPFAFLSCNSKYQTKDDTTASKTESSISLPYEASYTTDFTKNVPDSELLVVLNSYKAWENGDMNALRATMGDSMIVNGSNGYKFAGLTDSLMKYLQSARDSLSSVKITMEVWLKNHSVKDSNNYINVWYKEIDTYKSGKIDSAGFEDDNGLRNGKIAWYSSHKQVLK